MIKQLLTFYGIGRFFAVFTRVRHWTLSATIILHTYRKPYLYEVFQRDPLMHLCLTRCFLFSGFTTTIMCAFRINMSATCLAHLTPLVFTTIRITNRVQVIKLPIIVFSPPFTTHLFKQNIPLNILC